MLNEIIHQQIQINQQHLLDFPEAQLSQYVQPTDRDLLSLLRQRKAQHKMSYLFECKQASPSKGKINHDYNLKNLAHAYNPFAQAISVLTNTPYFEGSLKHLSEIRKHTHLPILCKDFILTPHQVFLARYFGADAVLLMLSVLSDRDYRACKALAEKLNMTVLTEVHTHNELHRALNLEAELIGINQRNLHDLSINRTLIPSLKPFIPEHCIVIAESGIRDHDDSRQLRPFVDGFLIGTALNQQPRYDLGVRALLFSPIKICGLTTPQAAACAYEHGAVMGGLNFISTSKRYISVAQAKTIQTAAPLNYIGIFANHAPDDIVNIVNALQLYAIQLHGHESESYIRQLRTVLPTGCFIFKAINGNHPLPKHKPDYIDKFVIDNQQGSLLGGTNQCFDWNVLQDSPILKHCILAGGIGIHNIRKAHQIGAYGLDINSSVETIPGKKDPVKLQALFKSMR